MFWNKDTPVYVYGAGLKGRLIYNLLDELGCNMCGFLDQASENIRFERKVFHPDQLAEEKRMSSIVICSVANVFEHGKIALELTKQGYRYIVHKEFVEGGGKIVIKK